MERDFEAAGVRVTADGPVVTVTLCRPEVRNAQLPSTWAALAEVADRLGDATRIVVIRGEGRSFSAGLDPRMFTLDGVVGEASVLGLDTLDDAAAEDQMAAFQRGFRWLRRPEIVSIAVVQGHAVGAGFQLALACDLRIVGDDAQFAMRETSLGLVPDLTGTHPLVEAVGYSRALEICLTGRWVSASEAFALGLATVVVPAAELADATRDLVDALLQPPSGAVRATKQLLLSAIANQPVDQAAAERRAQLGRLKELAQPHSGNPGR